jgi:hypothetical protein
MNLPVNPVSAEEAQEFSDFLKNNWLVPIFIDSGNSGFYSLKPDAKKW